MLQAYLKRLMIIATLMFTIVSQASPDGYWIIYDLSGKNKRSVVKISVAINEAKERYLSFKLISTFPNKVLKNNVFVCTECTGDFKNKTLDSISPLWGNIYSVASNKWEKGYLLQASKGKILRTSIEFSSDGATANMRVYKGVAMLGADVKMTRIAATDVKAIQQEATEQWSEQWSLHPDYYKNQKYLYEQFASKNQTSKLFQQINAQN